MEARGKAGLRAVVLAGQAEPRVEQQGFDFVAVGDEVIDEESRRR
jgi:hypothetical protein